MKRFLFTTFCFIITIPLLAQGLDRNNFNMVSPPKKVEKVLLAQPKYADFHYHKCTVCNHIWGHRTSNSNGVESHTCPRCRKSIVWIHYTGPIK